jgi:hypothetical protein
MTQVNKNELWPTQVEPCRAIFYCPFDLIVQIHKSIIWPLEILV